VRVALFISPHGFGHAARAAAVIAGLAHRRPELRFELFTTVPNWFFEDSLGGRVAFTWHELATDVGLVQATSVEEDLPATVERVERLVASLDERARRVASTLRELSCRLVVADISPLGLAAAEVAGLPSVLVENFTWDWIYAAYFDREPRLRPLAAALGELFHRASLRIRAEPVCPMPPGGTGTSQEVVVAPPVCRQPTLSREEVRAALGLERERPLILLTMGGMGWQYASLERLEAFSNVDFALLAGVPAMERRGNLLLLPDRPPMPVPNLIAAADVVVGKLGYSTVAEAWSAGARYAFVPRAVFPESPVLESFVRRELPSMEVSVEELERGTWLASLDALLERPRAETRSSAGADLAAEAIARWLPEERPER
jgi:hypothetical protein